MADIKQSIGDTAGVIWQHINKTGARTFNQLISELNEYSEQQILLSLGWLAREDNIIFENQGNSDSDKKNLLKGFLIRLT